MSKIFFFPWFMVMSATENEKQGEKVQLSFLSIEVRMAFYNKIFPTVSLSLRGLSS